MKKFLVVSKKIGSLVTIMAILVMMLPTPSVLAASVTSLSVTLSREKASTLSNYTIEFTTPTGVASSQTIILDFDNSTSIPVALNFEDIDLEDDGSDLALAAAPSGSTWGVVRTDADTITFTNGTTAIAASSVITIEIGTHATFGSTGAEQITNGSAGTTYLDISGTFGDTGTAGIPIIADDQVSVTATVEPSISFTISDNTVGFGTLTSGNARWATADTSGTASQPGATSGAHELTVGTNATGGYSVTYLGATLTSGADTISVATITGDGDGTPGSEQFALALDDNGGNVTIPSGYDYGSNNYNFVAGTTTQIASETGPSATETLDVQYIANISALTEAGNYATSVTFIATGTY